MEQNLSDENNLGIMFSPLISALAYALVKLELNIDSENPPFINRCELCLPNLMQLACTYHSSSTNSSTETKDQVAVAFIRIILSAAKNCKLLRLIVRIHKSSGFQTNFQFPTSITKLYVDVKHVGEWLRSNVGTTSNLRKLFISQCFVRDAPTANDFYNFLSACSKSLVLLELENTSDDDTFYSRLIHVAFPQVIEKVENLNITGGYWKQTNILGNEKPIWTKWPALKDLSLHFHSSAELSYWFHNNQFLCVERLLVGIDGGRPFQFKPSTVDEIGLMHGRLPTVTKLRILMGALTSEVLATFSKIW